MLKKWPTVQSERDFENLKPKNPQLLMIFLYYTFSLIILFL